MTEKKKDAYTELNRQLGVSDVLNPNAKDEKKLADLEKDRARLVAKAKTAKAITAYNEGIKVSRGNR